jgi:hypothetical protein
MLIRTLLWLLVGPLLSVSAAESGLRAGASKVEITPPTGHPMWGYASRKNKACVGVRDPLYARALVLDLDGKKIALVSLDLGRAPTRDSTSAVEAGVKKEAGVDHVFLVASHTHHGPVLEMNAWPDRKMPYVKKLEALLVRLIVQADGRLRPAKFGVGSRQVKFNRNRHSKLPDGPVDRELLVLRVETKDGKPIAHAVNFAAHPTLLPASLLKFSADWPGAMAAVVEKETDAPCLFLQGAAGDQSPDPAKGKDPEAFGKAVAAEVLALVKSVRCGPPRKGTLQVEGDRFTFASRVDLKNQAVKALFVYQFFPELIAFYEREYAAGIRPRMTTMLLDGRVGFVGVSGEFFSGHSLRLKKRARLEHLFFLGYCNDYQQYFPTIEAAAEGGYGADAPVSPAEVGAGERMMDRALIRLWKMRGRLPSLPPEKDS